MNSKALPDSWLLSTIGEVLNVRNGYAFKSKDYKEEGILLVRQSNLGGNKISADKAVYLPQSYLRAYHEYIVKKGDILIGMSGSIGKLCIYDRNEPALQNQRTGLLVFKNEALRSWVWYFLPTLDKNLKDKGKGVAVQNISASQIEALPIPIAPPNDQKRIVAEIEKQFSRLDEAITALKRIQANLKRYKASVLKAAVEGKLTEQWRKEHPDVEPASELLKRIFAERKKKWEKDYIKKYLVSHGHVPKDDSWKKKYKEPAAPDTINLPELPKAWVWAAVGQLADVRLGKMLDRKKHRSGKELPYIRNINVRWRSVDTSDLLTMFFKDSELGRYCLQTGDVLICEGGEPGRAAVWDGRISSMMYQKAIHRVRFPMGYKHKLLVFLLEYLAKSGRLTRWFTGSTIKHFTGEALIQLPIPLPPEGEQQSIVSEVERLLSVAEEFDSRVDINLKRAERMRQSILKKAFSGKLVQ